MVRLVERARRMVVRGPVVLVGLIVTLGVAAPTSGEEHVITFTEPRVTFQGEVPPVEPAEAPADVPLPGRARTRVSPPGVGDGNPRFLDGPVVVEAFWAASIGAPGAYFTTGHFHPRDLAGGFEGQHYGGRDELHGIFIRAIDGRPFSVRSLKYRVTMNRELANQNRSIAGYSNFNINVLLSTSFYPALPVVAQFVPFAVGLPQSNDPTLPFTTLAIQGFEHVQQVFIASSGSVDLDDIVIELH